MINGKGDNRYIEGDVMIIKEEPRVMNMWLL